MRDTTFTDPDNMNTPEHWENKIDSLGEMYTLPSKSSMSYTRVYAIDREGIVHEARWDTRTIKSLIKSFLSSYQEELIGKVEGMKTSIYPEYNRAVSEFIKLIKGDICINFFQT